MESVCFLLLVVPLCEHPKPKLLSLGNQCPSTRWGEGRGIQVGLIQTTVGWPLARPDICAKSLAPLGVILQGNQTARQAPSCSTVILASSRSICSSGSKSLVGIQRPERELVIPSKPHVQWNWAKGTQVQCTSPLPCGQREPDTTQHQGGGEGEGAQEQTCPQGQSPLHQVQVVGDDKCLSLPW